MPRTKVSRNVGSNKRAREHTVELEEIARDFQIEAENSYDSLKSELNKALREIGAKFEETKRQIPANILAMKMKDLKKLRSLENDVFIQEKMTNLNATVKESVQKADEEEAASRSQLTSGSESGGSYKPLETLKKIQSRRRSKSATNLGAIVTPGPRSMMSVLKVRTPIAQQMQPKPHVSRSKYRTPINTSMRSKAMSADRINTITPKVNPNNPFSMLRHARAGEAVFSVTGSPIVPSSIVEITANVNIPVADGILSIRPQSIDANNLDPTLVNRIDQNTFRHLRTLKANLDILMAGVNNRFKN